MFTEDGENFEAVELKNHVTLLQTNISDLQKATENQLATANNVLGSWKEYRAGLQSVKPWVEQAEVKVSIGMAKPTTIEEAKELQLEAKVYSRQLLIMQQCLLV